MAQLWSHCFWIAINKGGQFFAVEGHGIRKGYAATQKKNGDKGADRRGRGENGEQRPVCSRELGGEQPLHGLVAAFCGPNHPCGGWLPLRVLAAQKDPAMAVGEEGQNPAMEKPLMYDSVRGHGGKGAIVGVHDEDEVMRKGHRWALLRLDKSWAEHVAALERQVFVSAWDAETYRRFLAQPRTWAMGAVADVLVGYLVGTVVADVAEIVNLAVHPSWRRQGIGQALVLAALEHWRCCGAEQVGLEVRAGNTAALTLYSRCGFEAAGRRCGYYTDPHEDAVVLVCTLAGRCQEPKNG